MTTMTKCRNCGLPAHADWCPDHLIVDTASRLAPAPGALATTPAPRVYTLSEHDLRAFADDVLEHYQTAAEHVHPGNPAVWGMLAREEALDALDRAHGLPPLPPLLVAEQRPPGMLAWCSRCESWWTSRANRDAHVRDVHGPGPP